MCCPFWSDLYVSPDSHPCCSNCPPQTAHLHKITVTKYQQRNSNSYKQRDCPSTQRAFAWAKYSQPSLSGKSSSLALWREMAKLFHRPVTRQLHQGSFPTILHHLWQATPTPYLATACTLPTRAMCPNVMESSPLLWIRATLTTCQKMKIIQDQAFPLVHYCIKHIMQCMYH